MAIQNPPFIPPRIETKPTMATAASFLFVPNLSLKPSIPAKKFPISLFTLHLSVDLVPHLAAAPPPILRFRPCSAVQDIAAAEETKGTEEESEAEDDRKQKIYVVNLPWSYSAPEIEKLFGECGAVNKVEIIKQKDGKSKGFAFVTMDSREAALAAVEKFNSYELLGRVIKVEFAKSFRKPSAPSLHSISVEARHKIYAANLAWKVRSDTLKDFFSAKFNPMSARVVLNNPSGRSTGYGFVSFSTKEEADAALAELNGKELMGRPLRLSISEKKGDELGSKPEKTDSTGGQSEET